ncbi:uncharacterized protein [Spinacia oleracea]|nr:uncharacterized protein LOC110804130 isoform X2 [Spinacia oleracea]
MPSFDKVDGNLGYHEDKVEEAEDKVEEAEKESVSEEAVKLLQYREKLKEKYRSKLRQENGTQLSISQDEMKKPALKNFGNFFGPSVPSFSDRGLKESKSLFEIPSFAQKASNLGTDSKKVGMSCLGPKTGTISQPPLYQVKPKAQIFKSMRGCSFLSSDEAEVPKPMNNPEQQNILVLKPDGRSVHVPSKSNEPSAEPAIKISNANKRKKPLKSLQVCNTHTAPPRKSISCTAAGLVSSDSRRLLDVATRSQPIKQTSSIGVSKPVRHTISKGALPPSKPLSSSDEKVPGSSMEQQTSGVSNNLERERLIPRRNERSVLKKENAGVCKLQNKLSKQSSGRDNLDSSLIKKQIVHQCSGGINKDQSKKEPRDAQPLSDDDDCDLSSVLKKLRRGPPSQYEDGDDDVCVAAFKEIQKEELRSAKIGKQEDKQELAKIMEEERRERPKKKAKLCQMSR